MDDVYSYVLKVRDDIATFLRSGADESYERVVSSHYGGQVSVSTCCASCCATALTTCASSTGSWENVPAVQPSGALAEEDLHGIVTPDELFDTGA